MTAIVWAFSLWRLFSIWTMLTNKGQWYCCWILTLKKSSVVNVTACVTTVRNSWAWEVWAKGSLSRAVDDMSCHFSGHCIVFTWYVFNVTPLLIYHAPQYDVAPLTMCLPFYTFSRLRKMRFKSMIAGFSLIGEQRTYLLPGWHKVREPTNGVHR